MAAPGGGPGGLDPLVVERLRQTGIRIDREGELIHEGEPIRHQGLRQAIFRWLDRLPDGRYILRLDAKRYAYVDVDDTPLVARAACVADDGGVLLTLSDGSEERLAPQTLTVDAEGVMRCLVRGGQLAARLSTSVASVLADRIVEAPGKEGGADGAPAFLDVGGVRYPLVDDTVRRRG